jgi:hypothetical protein
MAAEFDKTQERFVLDFPGSAGVVTFEGWRTSKPFLAVNGVRVISGVGGTYQIPMTDGTATKAKVKIQIGGSVKVESGGRTVFSTPSMPGGLIAVSLLPLLLLVLMQGAIGFALAFGLAALNMSIVRNQGLSTAARYLIPVGIFVGAVAVELTIIAAVLSSRS